MSKQKGRRGEENEKPKETKSKPFERKVFKSERK